MLTHDRIIMDGHHKRSSRSSPATDLTVSQPSKRLKLVTMTASTQSVACVEVINILLQILKGSIKSKLANSSAIDMKSSA